MDCEALIANLNLILALGWVWISRSYFMNDLLQAIQSDFIQGIQAHAQVACGETFFVHPDQVILRNITKQAPLVFAKGHPVCDDIDQNLGIHGAKIPIFFHQKYPLSPLNQVARLGN